jgi:sugar phosphate isomerase/epimerase
VILVSTAGLAGTTGVEAARKLLAAGITRVELSGGVYSETVLDDLRELRPEMSFHVHNYFPPPPEPFVLNLGSLDEQIGQQSMAHVESAIEFCAAIGSDRYSVHAGFLIDPRVAELGHQIAARELFDRGASIEVFVERITAVARLARAAGVKLMVENNVVSSANQKAFGGNPLLMCDPDECQSVMRRLPSDVGLLVDVAHLKVSARTLGFDPERMFAACGEWISGYHLSDNDGVADSNEPISEDSWFWPYLDPSVGYFTIEVYQVSVPQLRQQVRLVESQFATQE